MLYLQYLMSLKEKKYFFIIIYNIFVRLFPPAIIALTFKQLSLKNMSHSYTLLSYNNTLIF